MTFTNSDYAFVWQHYNWASTQNVTTKVGFIEQFLCCHKKTKTSVQIIDVGYNTCTTVMWVAIGY